MNRKIVVISGPTASGKTDLSLSLAQSIGGEIVNFDSLLFYKEISIGTAKPTPSELKTVPHHMINNRSIFEPINAADYFKEAIPLINDCLNRGPVFLVGGSGFYLQTVLNGMFDSVTSPPEVLEKSDQLFESQGITPFIQVLREFDPISHERYHDNDHYRIRRAVEHYWATGTPFSQSREQMKHKRHQAPPVVYDWNVLHIYLDIPKEDHWPIIQKRTEKMMQSGIIDEVKDLLENGASGDEKPLKSVGYLEVVNFLKGEISSLEECSERISISTRQLAKAQRTWFKKVEKRGYNPLTEWDKIVQTITEFINGHS